MAAGFLWAVAKRHHFDQIRRAFPAFREYTSALTARKSHGFLFGLVQGDSFRFGRLPRGTEFIRENPKVDNDSQVMEQTREIRLRRIAIIDLACQMTTDQRAP